LNWQIFDEFSQTLLTFEKRKSLMQIGRDTCKITRWK